MERQTRTKTDQEKCAVCGASRPRHFQDCMSVPGGKELDYRNEQDRKAWEAEEYVPRDRGKKLLQMILDMGKGLPEDREGRKKVLDERKAKIHEAIDEEAVPF